MKGCLLLILLLVPAPLLKAKDFDPLSSQTFGDIAEKVLYPPQDSGDTGAKIAQLQVDAANGDPRAQTELGFRLKKGLGVERNLTEAVHWFQKAADQDYLEGELQLGMAELDLPDATNHDAGIKWVRKAADRDSTRAQTTMGMVYQMGVFVPKDVTEAIKWYRKAGEKEEPMAVMLLGMVYGDGKDAPEDEAESLKWLRLSADQDNALSQFMLGATLNARTNNPERTEGAKWLRLSAEQGHAGAQMILGFVYQYGVGVAKDPVEAFVWFQLGAGQGNGKTKIPADLLDELTPAQLAQGSRRVAAFKPRKSRITEFISGKNKKREKE